MLPEARSSAPLPLRLQTRLLDVAAGRHTPGMPLDWEDADLVAESLIEVHQDRGRRWAEITDWGRVVLGRSHV